MCSKKKKNTFVAVTFAYVGNVSRRVSNLRDARTKRRHPSQIACQKKVRNTFVHSSTVFNRRRPPVHEYASTCFFVRSQSVSRSLMPYAANFVSYPVIISGNCRSKLLNSSSPLTSRNEARVYRTMNYLGVKVGT